MILEIARKHFPYATPNPGQLETVVEAVRAFRGGKKHVIVQAPTGIGKTAIATTVHRVMRELDEKHRTTIITATKGLQDQYVDSDKLVYDLKGKTNYACPFDVGPYNSGGCRAKVASGGCKKQESCPYVMRRTRWCNQAQLRLTNNSFQIEACPSICMMEDNRADLIIADECHDLDDHIVDHTTIRFYANEYINLKMFGYGDFVDDLRKYINLFHAAPTGVPFKITSTMYEGMMALHDKVTSMIETFEGWLEQKDRHDHELVGDLLETLQQIGDKTEIFDSALEGEWIVHEWKESNLLVVKPVYAWQVSEYALFRKARYFLHMSATICGDAEYAGGLGIKGYEFLDVPNPIPVEARRVYYFPKHKVSGAIDYDALTHTIDKLVAHNEGKNGLIHTVSYALANEVYRRSTQKDRMLVSKDRYEIVSELTKPKKGSVVLSASIEKGFDAKGDMARFQIIPKVPYLYLGDPLVKLNSSIRPDWYARKAVLRIVQACGRVTRGVDDHGVTYIIDSNFGRLLSQNIDMFPSWFTDSLVISNK
jgi:Rad3-related DNA helicase